MTSTITTTLTVLITILAFVGAIALLRETWRAFDRQMEKLHQKHRMDQHRAWQAKSKGAVAWARESAARRNDSDLGR